MHESTAAFTKLKSFYVIPFQKETGYRILETTENQHKYM
jgi:hypothetical protein